MALRPGLPWSSSASLIWLAGIAGAEQETLALLASERAQDIKLFLGLDALGERHEAQAVADIDCGPDQFL